MPLFDDFFRVHRDEELRNEGSGNEERGGEITYKLGGSGQDLKPAMSRARTLCRALVSMFALYSGLLLGGIAYNLGRPNLQIAGP